MPTDVFQQIRLVEAGTVAAFGTGTDQDLDMDITISQSREKGLSFDCTIKNLADSSWNGIQQGDPARISLGWLETEAPPVILGVIEQAYTEPAEQDTDYVIKGRDETDIRFAQSLSKTWDTLPPDQIARQIASELGVSAGQIDSVGQPIDGYYQIDKQRPARYWLDELTKEAEKRSDAQWTWFGEAGKFYFMRQDTTIENVIQLSDSSPRNLMEIGPAAGRSTKTSGGEELDFKSICVPGIRKNGLVSVSSENYSGVYKVVQYEHYSDTISGEHTTSGTLVSQGAQYESRYSEGARHGAGGRILRPR